MRMPLLTTAILSAAALCLGALPAFSGPPFVTDDPEPVELRHWEIFVASEFAETAEDRSGTAPHVEVNYGPLPNLQVGLRAPLAFDAPAGGVHHYGYGDMEAGAKYRFVRETAGTPQVSFFPHVEIPTGSVRDDLGSGHLQLFLPVWVQKSWGAKERPWTSYGGAGYDIHPGAGNRDWGLVGIVLQRQLRENLLLGSEVYHQTATTVDGQADTAFNLGTIIDFSDEHHVIFSAGRSIDGPTRAQAFVAYQLTIGPRK